MKPQALPILLLCAGLPGCAWLSAFDEASTYEAAEADHQRCRERGYEWPGDAYVECRRQLADNRERARWQELNLSRPPQQNGELGIPQTVSEPYRPIREDSFACRDATTRDGDPYVHCEER